MSVRAGNRVYAGADDLPEVIPVFPLSGALLLPNGQMPLNIFEPRYMEMIDHAMSGDRLIGMIQPKLDCAAVGAVDDLCAIGCLGRITQYGETGDDRYIVTLSGVSRYRIVEEIACNTGFRQCRISVGDFADDLDPKCGNDEVDRDKLICAFRQYLDANGMEADWESVHKASKCGLLTALAMMSPWGPAEKQVLLEAPDQKSRAETLIAMTEIALAGASATLQ